MDYVTDYVASLSVQLSEWDQRLARLRERARQAPAPTRLNLFSDMELLELRRKVVAERLKEISEAGAGATDEQRRALEHSWVELRGALRDLDLRIG